MNISAGTRKRRIKRRRNSEEVFCQVDLRGFGCEFLAIGTSSNVTSAREEPCEFI
jgi:hypothetical protein